MQSEERHESPASKISSKNNATPIPTFPRLADIIASLPLSPLFFDIGLSGCVHSTNVDQKHLYTESVNSQCGIHSRDFLLNSVSFIPLLAAACRIFLAKRFNKSQLSK